MSNNDYNIIKYSVRDLKYLIQLQLNASREAVIWVTLF